jgi:nucleotide-binding universal stress UspA family protein
VSSILVGYDGSQASDWALRRAAWLAKRLGAGRRNGR